MKVCGFVLVTWQFLHTHKLDNVPLSNSDAIDGNVSPISRDATTLPTVPMVEMRKTVPEEMGQEQERASPQVTVATMDRDVFQ